MSDKPIYTAQNFCASEDEFEKWFVACHNEAVEKGARYMQAFKHPFDDTAFLVLGWAHHPKKLKVKPKFHYH